MIDRSNDAPPTPSKDELRAMMDRSDADLKAGRITPLDDVVADLRSSATSIRAKRNAKVSIRSA